MAVHPLFCLGRYFSFLVCTRAVVLLGRGISPSQGRHLHTGQHSQNKRTCTSMPEVGFEPTILVLERAKAVHDLDCATAVIARGESSMKYTLS
jgi:hypothetical protein